MKKYTGYVAILVSVLLLVFTFRMVIFNTVDDYTYKYKISNSFEAANIEQEEDPYILFDSLMDHYHHNDFENYFVKVVEEYNDIGFDFQGKVNDGEIILGIKDELGLKEEDDVAIIDGHVIQINKTIDIVYLEEARLMQYKCTSNISQGLLDFSLYTGNMESLFQVSNTMDSIQGELELKAGFYIVTEIYKGEEIGLTYDIEFVRK